MDVKIYPSKLNGEIQAVSSKSEAHRVIIASALADKSTKIYLNNISSDIKATLDVIKVLGGGVSGSGNEYIITPIDRENIPNLPELNAVESGTTLRFLLPVVSAITDKSFWQGEKSLIKRPLSELLFSLLGVGFSSEKLPLTINGRLKSGNYKITGSVSSQYISGLLFALPLLVGDSTLSITGERVSTPYIDMTLSVLKKFNIKIDKTEDGYYVKGGQKYISPSEITVEGDYSNASFFLAPNYLGGKVLIKGLCENTFQGDKKFTEFADSIIKGKNKRVLDMMNNPDLVPILSVIACFIDGETEFINAGRLRGKESNRILAMVDIINKLGGSAVETKEGLIVTGVLALKGGVYIDSYSDHRIAMASAIASNYCDNPVVLLSAEAVKKSYPTFFNDFIKLGGKVNAL